MQATQGQWCMSSRRVRCSNRPANKQLKSLPLSFNNSLIAALLSLASTLQCQLLLEKTSSIILLRWSRGKIYSSMSTISYSWQHPNNNNNIRINLETVKEETQLPSIKPKASRTTVLIIISKANNKATTTLNSSTLSSWILQLYSCRLTTSQR